MKRLFFFTFLAAGMAFMGCNSDRNNRSSDTVRTDSNTYRADTAGAPADTARVDSLRSDTPKKM